MKFKPIDIPNLHLGQCKNPQAFISDKGLRVLVSIDETSKWGDLKHVSVSHPKRLLFWDELLKIKQHFFGDIDCMMVMPKKADYVNLHKYTFHIWQCPETWGIR